MVYSEGYGWKGHQSYMNIYIIYILYLLYIYVGVDEINKMRKVLNWIKLHEFQRRLRHRREGGWQFSGTFLKMEVED